MKPEIKKRPARRRSQTHGGTRRRKGLCAYASMPMRSMTRVRLPALGLQRSVAMIATAGLAVLMLALFTMPDYAVKTINITGNLGTPAEDLQNAVSFAQGHNVFLLRSRDVVAAVMALPGVEKAEAHVSLPGQLDVAVKDVRPEVVWQTVSQALWVDNKGIVRDQPPVQPERTLTIKDVSGKTYQKGDSVDVAALSGAQKLMVLMPKDIQGFEFQRAGELVVVSNQGWSALFNTRGNLDLQVSALYKTLSSARGAGLLDVRVPDVVGLRPTATR